MMKYFCNVYVHGFKVKPPLKRKNYVGFKDTCYV